MTLSCKSMLYDWWWLHICVMSWYMQRLREEDYQWAPAVHLEHQSEAPSSSSPQSLSFISDEERWAPSLLCRGCFRCTRCSYCAMLVKRPESMGFVNKETIPPPSYPIHPFLPHLLSPKGAAFSLIYSVWLKKLIKKEYMCVCVCVNQWR